MSLSSIRYLTAVLTLALIVLAGCGENSHSCCGGSRYSGLVILNVLDKELYDDCHIAGSIHVPFDEIESFALDHIDRNANIVIYCSNYQCTTSEYSAKKIKQLGYDNVTVYEGGMAEWFQEGMPVEGACKSSYLGKSSRKMTSDEPSEIQVITLPELAEMMGIEYTKKVQAAA